MHVRRSLKFLGLLAVAGALAAPLALAQSDDEVKTTDRHNLVEHKDAKKAALYPNATRAEKPANASSDTMAKNVNKLHALVDAKQNDEAIALATTMVGDPKANHFEKAAAYQAIGYANFGKHDYAKAAEALQAAVTEDALPNDDHFQTMFNLAQAQIASSQIDAGLATLGRLVSETKQDKPEYNGIRGRAYYMKKDYGNAAASLQKSLDGAGAKPDPNEQQMLFAAYYELKQADKAVALGEGILKNHPDDKASMMNLAAAYQQAGQSEKTRALLDDARKRGMLSTANDYRNLIQLYSHVKGGEAETVAIINEGLQKGALQPTADVYSVLAQDYYAMNKPAETIEAYKKADAASSDGEAALNLAKVYNNEGRRAEARAAAQHALSKGVADRQAAQRIIAAGGDAKPAPKKK